MAQTKGILERVFKLSEKGTTVKTEILAGLTTFVAMAYIIFVNPSILADAGIPFDEQLVVNVEEATNAASEAGRVFDEIKPDGIFCFNDVRATFIYEAARERGVRIGTDVSVISIDNQPLITDVLKPALTTLELPHYEMGFEAVHQLIDEEAATESLARSEDSIRRSENGPMTPLRCRIIERDSIVS